MGTNLLIIAIVFICSVVACAYAAWPTVVQYFDRVREEARDANVYEWRRGSKLTF